MPATAPRVVAPAPTSYALARADLAVADAVGALMELWGFLRQLGRIWAVLFLSDRPLAAPDLCERLHTVGRAVGTIGECAKNVARIVDGLKVYAHLDRSQLEDADIRRGLEATLTVLQPRIPSGVHVETRFDPIPPFRHRPGELTQVWDSHPRC